MTHSIRQHKIDLKPIYFRMEETKEVWLCCCKQTNNRPFCDGSHRSKFVEESLPYDD